jgi:hypothetical protein
MNNWLAVAVGSASLLGQLALVAGCSSSTPAAGQAGEGSVSMAGRAGSFAGAGGTAAAGGAGGSLSANGGGGAASAGEGAGAGTGGSSNGGAAAGGAAAAGAGGSTSAGAGGSASSGVCAGQKNPNTDVATSCNSANAKSGATCTQDCCISCGIADLGTQTCTCTQGKYSACACPIPDTWSTLGGICGDSACLTSGGPCAPQGYASAAGAPAHANVLNGATCYQNGNVCFTAEADGKHGCLCASTASGDFVMECGLVNGWFTNTGMATEY